MGAAFGVALVLIYILVVWEFGNFRIPLVIMAPIPLTLLGIIPAHAVMFALGQGGEFTATSMIGWIALAGIIVRNSILLVDFAVHEIQKGVPVAEAMIRSCKIRTRPILITALALVAGSSVIITDPIFQGMAISLLSGVLVSTLLTLIVIPLGCVAAKEDMCKVAAASMPAGVAIPCLMAPERSTSGSSRSTAVEKTAKPRRSLMLRLWGGLIEALVLVFYAIRGIFLLLGEAFKGLRGKKPKPAPRRPSAQGASVSTPVADSTPADAPTDETDQATPSPEVAIPAKASSKKTTAKRVTKPKSTTDEARKTATTPRKTARRGIRLKDDTPSDSN
ncbi:MAG: efflux RND transporter permease subunit [Chromatiales bacterium]|nr:efflux RND transporter permease subunit [Chromatiales bacterium]